MFGMKRFISGVISLQAGTAVLMCINFITGIVIARFLGAENLGTYALVIALLNTTYLLIDLGSGISQAVVTELSIAYSTGDKEKMADTIICCLKQYIFLSSLISGIGFLVSPYISIILFGNPQIGILARPLFLLGFLQIPYELILCVMHALQKMRLLTLIENAYWGFRLIFILIALMMGFGIQGIIYGWIIAATLCSLISYIAYLKFSMKIAALPALNDIYKRIWKIKSAGIFRLGLSITVDRNIDNLCINLPMILLGRFSNASEVGYFKAAMGMISLPLPFLGAISRNLVYIYPEYILKDTTSGLRRFFKNISLTSGLISILITLLFMALAPYLVNTLYGKEYLPSIKLFYTLGLYLVIAGFSVGLEPLYRTLKKINLAIQAKVFALAILFLPGWILVKNADRLGAAFFASSLYLTSSLIVLSYIYPLLKDKATWTKKH